MKKRAVLVIWWFFTDCPSPILAFLSANSSCLQRTKRHPTTTRLKIKKSAFGSAAIGKAKKFVQSDGSLQKKKPTQNEDSSTTKIRLTKQRDRATLRYALSTKQVLKRRDNALLALKTHLNLPLASSIEILNAYPRLYTHLSDLSTKLEYLLNDINLKPRQIRRMLESHPRLMETLLLDKEENITNTIEVLQTELDLTMDDIKTIQSTSLPAILTYPRSELRKRIQVYKFDLGYTKNEIKKMVWKDPRMLRTDSKNVRQMVQVLREELDMDKNDIHIMQKKEILLLTYNAEENIRPTIRYLKHGPVGTCLGMVERKGISTNKTMDRYDPQQIVQSRLKHLIMGHPKILSSSINKNLIPTVHFFLHDLNMTHMEFGRAMYRRGGSILEANLERTLKRKVQFLQTELGLNISLDDETMDQNDVSSGATTSSTMDMVELPNVQNFHLSTLTHHQKQRLLAQMLATNPDILTLSIENNLQPKISYLKKSLGLETNELCYILLKRPQILALSLDRNIIPKIEFLTLSRDDGGLGLTLDQVRLWITHYPQILVVVLEKCIKSRVQTLIRLGLTLDMSVCSDPSRTGTSTRGSSDNETVSVPDDTIVPIHFLTMTESRWQSWCKQWNVKKF
jgi:hypothetical protein